MSESWSTLTSMAESAARSGKYAEAKDCYSRALADAKARSDAQNGYHTLCNYAGLLRLLDEYAPAEELLRTALQLRYDYPVLVREPVSPLTDLERILVKLNRLPELEQLLRSDAERMMAVFGGESFEYKMSLMGLAKMYGTQLKDMDRCRLHFREVLDWAKTAEPITRKMMYMNFDGVLRGAGLAAEADALQQELEALKNQSPA